MFVHRLLGLEIQIFNRWISSASGEELLYIYLYHIQLYLVCRVGGVPLCSVVSVTLIDTIEKRRLASWLK